MSLRAIASQTAHAPHRPHHPRPGNGQGEVAHERASPQRVQQARPCQLSRPEAADRHAAHAYRQASTTKRKPRSRRPRASARADKSCNGRARVGREEAMIGYTFITAPSSPGSARTVTPCATLTRCEDCGAEKDMRLDTLRKGARCRCKERAEREAKREAERELADARRLREELPRFSRPTYNPSCRPCPPGPLPSF